MSGHRQAAVALHALGEADRMLVLAELPENDQQILRGYLTELDDLGFEAADTAAAARDLPRAADALVDARAADVHHLLQAEPASLVAQVLSIQSWRWRTDYLALQTSARRDQLRAAAPDAALPAARAAFLIDGLRQRLEGMPAVVPGTGDQDGRKRPNWLRLVKLPWTR
jgi:hypothetical protein